jgi:DNA-binding PadR family transcriptional regulator
MEDEVLVTPTEIALLGLLAEDPQHPWELSKQVAYREMRTWTELSQSTIYKLLRSLQARDLVDATEITVSGRLRHQYSLTESGRQTLEEGILGLLHTPTSPRWPIDIATYNIDLVAPDEALAALAQYAETLRERMQDWGRLEEFLRESGCPSHRWALARRAVHMIEGELRWIEEFSAELVARDAAHKPGPSDGHSSPNGHEDKP